MPFQVSPGVNVSEIDLTTVVPAVSTTEGAIAGRFQWGPVEERVLVDSEDRLVNIFNKPTSDNLVEFFTAANFLTYGNQLYVTRVENSALNASANGTGVLVKNQDHYENDYSAVDGHGVFVAKYAGTTGNSLKVSICPNASAWQQTFGTDSNDVANTAVSADADVAFVFTVGSPTVTITHVGNTAHTSAASQKFNVGDVLLSSNNLVLGQVSAVTSNTTLTLTGNYSATTNNLTVGNASASVNNPNNIIKRRWEYFGSFDQAPTTTVFATDKGATGDEFHMVVVDEDGKISGTKGAILEAWASLSKASDAKGEQGGSNYYKDVINQQSQWLWWAQHPEGTTSWGSKASDETTYSETSNQPIVKSFSGASDGTALGSDDYIRGYDLYKTESVDVSFLLGGEANQTVATYLIDSIASVRRDCIAVISPEKADCVNNNGYEGKERDDVIAYRDLLPSSSYAVIDSGWKYQYDKYNDQYVWVPLNADTAGLMVQTDLTRDPWYSPAGFNRGNVKNVIKLSWNPSKADRDQLYKKGINPIVTFPGQGTVLYGDKTMLTKPSAFDRINVRRLFIVLEKAISTAARFTLFEFNDEFTRSQFKNLVEPFLRDVQGRRGITDFQVVCDGTNNTGEVIDRNEFVGDIYIKPARSINFIQLNFVAVRTGVEFSEVVGRAG
jgi:hypothetical protein